MEWFRSASVSQIVSASEGFIAGRLIATFRPRRIMATCVGRADWYVSTISYLEPNFDYGTAIIGLQGFFSLKGQAAVGVGSIEFPIAERKRLAVL
jgi:hypothetical protein